MHGIGLIITIHIQQASLTVIHYFDWINSFNQSQKPLLSFSFMPSVNKCIDRFVIAVNKHKASL